MVERAVRMVNDELAVHFRNEKELAFAQFRDIGYDELYGDIQISCWGGKTGIPGQMLRASLTMTRMCCGHSSILHARYIAVDTTRYGFVLRISTLR